MTDKFCVNLITGSGSFTPSKKNGTVIITDGNGNINNILVKKGDRLFFNSDDTLVASGNLTALVCC